MGFGKEVEPYYSNRERGHRYDADCGCVDCGLTRMMIETHREGSSGTRHVKYRGAKHNRAHASGVESVLGGQSVHRRTVMGRPSVEEMAKLVEGGED